MFTKLDKRKRSGPRAEENMQQFLGALADVRGPGLGAPPALATSSREGRGREALLQHIALLRRAFERMPE